jgi:2-methylisocitrate lyase-like PEP mutase family enzyme
MPTTPADKRARFRRLHQEGCFVMPNPWDVGGAKWLERLGFPALASTSAGAAWAQARPDGGLPIDAVLDHLSDLATAVDLPLNADFMHGFAADADGVGRNVALAVATGVAGLSIEDSTGDPLRPLFEVEEAAERIRAARCAIDETGPGVVLTGRSEGFLVGRPDLKATIQRLVAYAEAGADCLYAPGVNGTAEVAEIVRAVAPRPVNVLVGAPGPTVRALAEAGARRISTGGALARAAYGAMDRAARELLEQGTFGGLAGALPFADLDEAFGTERHPAAG